MPEHPCSRGLTDKCFRDYPKWARQALAYKLLHLFLPKQLSRLLPRLSPPPGLSWPFNWTPWLAYIFNPEDPEWASFPAPPAPEPGPSPEPEPSPTAPGVPPGFPEPQPPTPADTYPPLYPTPTSSPVPPLYVPPGPSGPSRPPPSRPQYSKTATFCTGWESVYAEGWPWATVRNTVDLAGYYVLPGYTHEYYQVAETVRSNSTYTIVRSILRFIYGPLPPNIKVASAFISLYVKSGAGKYLCVQRAPSAVFGSADDYLSFAGPSLGAKPVVLGLNTFPLTGLALAYIQASGSIPFYFMVREYSHDFQNHVPLVGESNAVVCWTHAESTGYKRPRLTVTYTV